LIVRAANSAGVRQPTCASTHRPAANARLAITINRVRPATKIPRPALTGTPPMLPAALQGTQAVAARGPTFRCGRAGVLCFCFIARTATVLSRGSQIHSHCWSPPSSPWLRAVHLLRHPFRWPLLSPTAIWDLKCLVSLLPKCSLHPYHRQNFFAVLSLVLPIALPLPKHLECWPDLCPAFAIRHSFTLWIP